MNNSFITLYLKTDFNTKLLSHGLCSRLYKFKMCLYLVSLHIKVFVEQIYEPRAVLKIIFIFNHFLK